MFQDISVTMLTTVIQQQMEDLSPPPAGTTLSYVRGVVMEVVSGGQTGYYIAPLLPTDIGPSTFIPPTISNRRHFPVIATSSNL